MAAAFALLVSGCSTVKDLPVKEHPVAASPVKIAQTKKFSCPIREPIPEDSPAFGYPDSQATCTDAVTAELYEKWGYSTLKDGRPAKIVKASLQRYALSALTQGLDGDDIVIYAMVLMQLNDQASTAPVFKSMVHTSWRSGRSLRSGLEELPTSFWKTYAVKKAGKTCFDQHASRACIKVILEKTFKAAGGTPPLHCSIFFPNKEDFEARLLNDWTELLAKYGQSPSENDRLRLRQHVTTAIDQGLIGKDVSMYVMVLMQLKDEAATNSVFVDLVREAVKCPGRLRDALSGSLPEEFWEQMALPLFKALQSD